MMHRREDFPPNPFIESTTFVPPEGPTTAKIVIVGEAPGRHEDTEGRPFVGGSGKLLAMFLAGAGLKREDIYITNVLKYRPPDNDITCSEAQVVLPTWRRSLIEELRKLSPRVIVPMGNVALQALGYDHKIGKARGAVIQSTFGKVIPTYHPAYVMRQWHDYYTCTHDWRKIAEHAAGKPIDNGHEVFTLEPTVHDIEMFRMNIHERLKAEQSVRLAIDLETYYIEGSELEIPLKMVGFALNGTHALVIPFITQAGNEYWRSDADALQAIMIIGDLLEDPRIEKVLHNALFDIPVLMNHGFTVRGPVFDTMLAHYLTYHPSKHGLDFLVSIYTDYPAWKLDKGYTDTEYRAYNARDCVVLHKLLPHLEADMEDNGVRFIFDVLMGVILPTAKMQMNGIYIDQEKYATVREMLEVDIKALVEQIQVVAEDPKMNPSSTKQLANLLFKKLKLKSGVRTKGGQQATSEDVIKRLSLRYPEVEVLNDILDLRSYETQYKMFIKNLPILSDGRVHSSFSLHSAVTGRYASSNPNMQNLPNTKDSSGYIRGMYTAPPGFKILQLDYSQVELMIFAVLSGDELWLEAFRNGDDVHVLNGHALMGDLYDNSKYRTFTKNFIYGFIYGSEGGEVEKVAPRELIAHLSIPQMMKNLAQTHPWLFEYREGIARSIENNRYVLNAFGRRRWFVGEVTKADMRSAYNFRIQSTAADIMHMKTPLIDEMLHDNEKMILQLHDAYYIEVPEDSVDRVASTVKGIMEEPVQTPQGHTFNLKADVEIGASLSKKDMEKWHGNRES